MPTNIFIQNLREITLKKKYMLKNKSYEPVNQFSWLRTDTNSGLF